MKETICWNCQKATGKCSWSAEGKKIKGWKATPTKIKSATAHHIDIDSFIVHKCPLFLKDDPKVRRVLSKELAQIFSYSRSNISKMETDKILNKASLKGIKLFAEQVKSKRYFYTKN